MEEATSMHANIPRIDAELGKFSQACTVLLTALAFILNLPVLVLITTIILALSALLPAASPYRLLYRYILVRLGWLKPRIVEDDPAPHRFAQGVGTVFLLASTIVLFFTPSALDWIGWALDLIVAILASINWTIGFCAGCFVYYHLGRLGILPKVRYEGDFHWRGV
ncbi:MAG TPA: DUF4395 domain-containing protein [Ktedonobacteraceae bacterium]